MNRTDELLQEWVEVSLVRDDTDVDQTKAQALAAGRFVLAFADARPGTDWDEIPTKVRTSAIEAMVEQAGIFGLSLVGSPGTELEFAL